VTRLARGAGVALVVYGALVLWALLAPTSTEQSGLVLWLGNRLRELGVPSTLATFDRLEVVMNVLIIAPVTLLASLIRPSYGWRDWTAVGFVAALAVELGQGLLLPDRVASFSDVVANACGALLGALLGQLLARVLAARSRRGEPVSSSDAAR
jgi:glycopeptide antibiotics resistance protein